ncbi:MAG: glycosyltransferase [Coriobacteriia bacterium]|nr:glycosyltransferase [Coriobacteriia bacterium]
MIEIPRERRATYLRNCRILSVIAAVFALVYLRWLLLVAKPENLFLYWILVIAEVFNIVQAAGYWITVSRQRWTEPELADFSSSEESIDIFVTVMGEPIDIVEKTVAAAARIRHPRAHVWLLDDGKSPQVRDLASRYPVGYIVRDNNRGAKAGNINHALSMTHGDYFAIFDADQIAHPEFLEVVMGVFEDQKVAFVQTPQVYYNRPENRVAAGAHDQQALFYGPILRGKNGSGAVFSCGTNVVFRRSAIEAIGGIPEDSVTEDLRASLLLLDKGFTSEYVAKVVAEGLGPMDVGSYFNQQFRWGRGGLEILFKRRPFSAKMRPAQAFQYALSFIYWFTGWAYLSYLLLPAFYLFAGARPVQVPNNYPVHFLPYVLSALALLVYSGNYQLRFDALWFTLASFPVQIKSLFSVFSATPGKFVVTPKTRGRVTLKPVRWQIAVLAGLTLAAVYGLLTQGPQPSVINNVAWIVAHVVILQGFVRYSVNPATPEYEESDTP